MTKRREGKVTGRVAAVLPATREALQPPGANQETSVSRNKNMSLLTFHRAVFMNGLLIGLDEN